MQKKVVTQLLVNLFLLYGCLFAGDEEKIKLIPLQHTEGKIDHIGFQMKVPWMGGTIELRFPETLDSEDGMHFIDHYRADMLPLSEMEKYPEWKVNEITGEIFYSHTTKEGIEFGGIVNSTNEEVHVEFFVKNNMDKPARKISPQICLALDNSNDFNNLRVTSDVFIWSEGKYLSLDKTTPTVSEKGRDALLVIAREGFTNIEAVGKTKIENPGSDIGTWWLVNETSDEDIIVRESNDKKHLVAISWPGEASFLICNSLNPCIHAGPSIQFTIDPKRERHWYGTIYLMKNNPSELFKRYKSGKRYN